MSEKRYRNTEILHVPESGFVRRRLRPDVVRLILVVLMLFACVIASVYFLKILGTIAAFSIISSMFVVLIFFIITHIDKLSDVVFTHEYEKAILAGAAGSDVEFLMIIRKNHEITYYNPSCGQYFNYQSPGERDGLDAFLATLELKEDAKEQIYAAIVSGRKARLPIALKTLNGEERRVNLSLYPIERPKGYFVLKATRYLPRSGEQDKMVNIDVPSFDITRSLGKVFDEMPWGVYKAKEDGTLIYVNHKLSSILGYHPDELINGEAKFRDIIFGNSLEPGSFNQRYEGNIAFKTKDGGSHKMYLKQIMIEGEKKPELYRCGFVIRDESRSDEEEAEDKKVYARRSSDKSFKEGEVDRIWHHFVEESPIAIVLLNADSYIVRTNEAFDDLVNKVGGVKPTLLEMLDDDAKNIFSTLMKTNKVSYEGERQSIDIHFAGNREVTVSLFVTPIDNNVDEVEYIVYLIDDSEKKNLERQFVQSQKMQAVGQLAGGIAHDFNNLLTAMIGFCDLLLTRYSPGEQSFADVMQIKQNANRAADLVRQLLAFSRKQTLQLEVMDVTEILSDISNLIRRLIGENIELKIKHGRGLSTVKVDQGQLEQVLVNLCVNARDAMGGKGVLTIRTRNCVVNKDNPLPKNLVSSQQGDKIADGDYVVIEVEDTGCGMSEEVQQKIFEPFFTTKDVGEGTGLGLATVLGIVEQTGGYVFVSSVEGQGTIFYIYIKHFAEDKSKKETKQEVVQEIGDLTGKGTILLVEDEVPVRMFGSRALKNKGYNVLEAEHGEEALSIIDQKGEDIDLIVTDVMMPGVTGPEMVEEVLKKYPDIKVIFISGYGEDAFIKSYGSEREFFFLPKPFTLNQLAAKVKEVLGG